MKNYVVINSCEYFKKISGVYKYQHLVDNTKNIYFESEEEAKKYIDNYKLNFDLDSSNLYLEYLELYKYDNKNDDIDQNESERKYDKAFNIEKFMEENNIKIEF